jgi:hypothetical protein
MDANQLTEIRARCGAAIPGRLVQIPQRQKDILLKDLWANAQADIAALLKEIRPWHRTAEELPSDREMVEVVKEENDGSRWIDISIFRLASGTGWFMGGYYGNRPIKDCPFWREISKVPEDSVDMPDLVVQKIYDTLGDSEVGAEEVLEKARV